MLILANPTDDLRSAYLEGLNIKNQFEHKRHNVHIDFKSTSIDKIYVKKSLSEYDLVHFAGHCEHQPNNQKNSGWVFEDGIFSIQDILAMGHGSVLPALIFSNACRSAKSGDNPVEFDCQKNNYSLAQAFLFSGVRHYIGAIRRIEDPLSFVFAKEFYSQLIAGKSVGESIRLGRLKLIKEYGISAIYWASYLLYGDPTFVLFRPAFKERRIKKGLIKYRKRLLVGICAFVLLVALSTCLFIFLPTLNPGTYYLFLKSKGLYQAGRNQEAISVLGQIIAREPLFLDAYPMLADTYLRLGERQAALKYYFDYALYSEKKEDQKSLASAYNHIGWFYHLGGDYLKAWEFYEKAISLSRQINDKLEEAIALRRQALWHIDSNQYDKAWELLIKSCEINRQRQLSYAHRFNLACDYFDLGLLFSEKDDYETAREFYKKSRATFQRLKAKDQLSDYFFNLGEIYLFEKQYQKALEYYMVGLKIDQKNGNLFSLASDYNMLGELCLAMDNLKDAEGYFIQAIQLSQRINILPCLAEGYHNLGSLYRRSGRKNQARAYLRLAQEIYAGIDQKSYLDIKKEILGLDQ
jgi:tetratricopeptide (TPR) repeat protein